MIQNVGEGTLGTKGDPFRDRKRLAQARGECHGTRSSHGTILGVTEPPDRQRRPCLTATCGTRRSRQPPGLTRAHIGCVANPPVTAAGVRNRELRARPTQVMGRQLAQFGLSGIANHQPPNYPSRSGWRSPSPCRPGYERRERTEETPFKTRASKRDPVSTPEALPCPAASESAVSCCMALLCLDNDHYRVLQRARLKLLMAAVPAIQLSSKGSCMTVSRCWPVRVSRSAPCLAAPGLDLH